MINPHLMSDKDLVRLYQKGNDCAINELVNRHKSRIFSYIFYKVHNRELAEDLFQDIFIKIILCIREKKYREESKFIAWALSVTHNYLIDYFRVKKRMVMVRDTDDYNIFDIIPSKEVNVLDTIIQDDKSQRIRKLLDRVSEDQREVIIMRHYGDLTFKEIAKILGINLNTCLSRMHQGIVKLKEITEREKIKFR